MPLFGPVGDDWPPQCQVNMQMSLRAAPAWPGKGYFAVRGGYCPCQCLQPLSNVTFGAALPRLASGASAKQQSAIKEKTLLWE